MHGYWCCRLNTLGKAASGGELFPPSAETPVNPGPPWSTPAARLFWRGRDERRRMLRTWPEMGSDWLCMAACLLLSTISTFSSLPPYRCPSIGPLPQKSLPSRQFSGKNPPHSSGADFTGKLLAEGDFSGKRFYNGERLFIGSRRLNNSSPLLKYRLPHKSTSIS